MTRTAMIEETFRVRGARGGLLEGEVRVPDEGGGPPLLVMVNGLLLSRDWGFYPFLASRLVEKGFPVLTYDSASRASVGEEPTVSDEIEDLGAILDAFGTGEIAAGARCARDAFGLIGHGKGGAVALVHSRTDPRVRAVAALAAYSTFHRFRPDEIARLERGGFLEVRPPGSRRVMRITRSFLDDLRTIGASASIEAAVRSLRIPLVFIHGEEDHVVSVDETETLYHWAEKRLARLIVLEKTCHSFGAGHPFAGTNRDLERLVDILGSVFGGCVPAKAGA